MLKSIIDQLSTEDIYVVKTCNCPDCSANGTPEPELIPFCTCVEDDQHNPRIVSAIGMFLWADIEPLEENISINPNDYMTITLSQASELLSEFSDFSDMPSFIRLLPEDKTIPVKNPLTYV